MWPALLVSHPKFPMKKILLFLVALILAGPGLGCGGSQQKGKNKDKDKPKPTAMMEPLWRPICNRLG